MRITIKTYWNLLEQYCKIANQQECYPLLDKDKFEDYKDAIEITYEEYKSRYLEETVQFLDRHKVAAILVVEGLKQNIMSPSSPDKVKNGHIFVGREKILLLSAIDYLIAHMNRIFKKNDLEPMKSFVYPAAFTCETKFIDVLSRTLYYANQDFSLNIMELAEKFFLLEYIAILQTFGDKSDKYFEALKKDSNNSNQESCDGQETN